VEGENVTLEGESDDDEEEQNREAEGIIRKTETMTAYPVKLHGMSIVSNSVVIILNLGWFHFILMFPLTHSVDYKYRCTCLLTLIGVLIDLLVGCWG